ncbi:ABC transporter substrate-binding protein [Nocardia sp. NBC_00508]|uniref:ABC transporter substrate-binding protein n=1 Tax=Nocardia sp. NBC_00508 TaxID=2975992 RepID=UPI002E815166|nr:ABC transporter substrate-binding protein [Nocardia sp. NBC_00508]WUD67086.1 ABC transporter substrate-binding protein [Nocardia sp. NBC_00508]
MTTVRGVHYRKAGGRLIALLAAVALASVACSPSNDESSGDGVVHGVTDEAIKIGFAVTDPKVGNNTFSKVGSEGVTIPDERGIVDAVVRHINENGGIAGRKVEPVFRMNTEDDTAPEMQAVCAAFTEETPVFAGYTTNASAGTVRQLVDCMVEHETVFLLNTRSIVDDKDFEKWNPYVYAPGVLSAQRWTSVIDDLAKTDYFGNGAKVGLVSIQEPGSQELVEKVVKPALEKKGVNVAATVATSSFSDLSGISQVASQANNFVVQFKNEGIDRVMFVGTYSAASWFFPQAAEQQNYHPRYALNSTEAPGALALNQPKAQLKGAVGVGWLPMLDVTAEQDPGDNGAQKECVNILQKAGVKADTRASEFQILGICDSLFFLQKALRDVEHPTAESLRDAVAKLGSSYQSPLTPRTDFGSGRSDGVGATRTFEYDEGCSCFKYKSAWADIP